MKITNLKLTNFRNYEKLNLHFSNYKNIIIDILDSKDDDSEECVRLLNKQKEYMNQMYDAASTVKEWFVELVDSVKGDE